MVMKVDLQCLRCVRKIKKVFYELPEIRDQMYDVKQNKVMVSVVTCCPDVILKKIASKGGRSVESIEIVPEKKKEPEKKDGDKDKKDAAAGGEKKDAAAGGEKKPAVEKKKVHFDKDVSGPVSWFPAIYPTGVFYNNQPYYQGYGSGVPMPCYGVPAYEGYVGNRGGGGWYDNTGRFGYFSEEHPESCSIM